MHWFTWFELALNQLCAGIAYNWSKSLCAYTASTGRIKQRDARYEVLTHCPYKPHIFRVCMDGGNIKVLHAAWQDSSGSMPLMN